MTETTPADPFASYESTLQHIGLIKGRIAHLERRRVETEDQLIHRIALDLAEGKVSDQQVLRFYRDYRGTAAPGFGGRWNNRMPEAMNTHRIGLIVRNLPDADGNWRGSYPLPVSDPAPMRNTSVVYVLFDADNVPCYVGSTGCLRTRLKQHGRDKEFVSWLAYPCEDRARAYEIEERALREHMPYLNQKAGR